MQGKYSISILLAFSMLLMLTACSGGGGDSEGGGEESSPSAGGTGSIEGLAVYSGASSHEGIQVTLLSGTVETTGTVVNQTTTSATGSYSFTGLAEGTYFLVASSSAADAPVTSSNQQLAEGEEVTVESLQLVPTGSISGTILRSDGGSPIGAGVFLAGRSFDSASDASGNFLMGKVEVGTYDLFVQLAGFDLAGPVSVAVTLGDTTTLAPITLSQSLGQGNVLFGSARLSDSTNHGGISIAITGNEINELTQTDTLGNYAFFNLPAGTDYVIAVTNPPDYLSTDLTGISVIERESNRAGTIILQAKPGTVDGVVTLAGELSHIGYTVEVLDTGPTFTQNDGAANGAFSIASVPAGSRILRMSKPGFETVLVDLVVPANGLASMPPRELTDLVGELSATFTLENAASHENIVVSLQSETTSDFYLGSTDTSGLVQLTGVRAGNYGLTAKKIGSNFTDVTLSVVPIAVGATTSLPNATFPDTLLALVAGSIAGTVNLNTSDFSGDTLKFVPRPCDDCQVTAAGQTVQTNPDGSFLLIGVPEGEHTVTVTFEQSITDQFDPFISPPVTISPTQTAFAFAEPINLFQATGTIVGVALLEGASEHFNIQVTVEGLAGYSVVTDALGNYAILSVPVGNYAVTATLGPDFVPATKSDVTVRAGKTTFLSAMQVVPLPGALAGTFLKDGFTDHSGIVISVGGQSGITDTNGFVSIPDIPAGVQTLTATADGFKAFSTVVTIPPNNLLTLTGSILAAQKGQIAGKVELAGVTDLTGVAVTLVGTTFSTTSAFDGSYSLLVSIGNYAGLEFQKSFFETLTFNQTITVTETGVANIPIQALTQIQNNLSGTATITGQTDNSPIRVQVDGLANTPTFGFSLAVSPTAAGAWNMTGVPLGEFTLTALHSIDPTFETVTRSISLFGGDPQIILPINIRQVFVKVNNDAAFTTDPNVTLSLGATNAATMRITDTGGGDSGVIGVQSSLPWTLINQGNNTVTATFFDSSGGTISSVSDTILLDSIATISSVTENSGGATLTRGQIIHFTLNANGETGGTATMDIVGFKTGIQLFDHGLQGDAVANDGVYEADITIITSQDIANAPVTGRFTDQLGNVATAVNALGTITVGTPPQISSVQVLPSTDAQSAIIQWVTDEPADSQVDFGFDTNYGSTQTSAVAETSHQLILTGLTRGQTYHFRITSSDPFSNQAQTGDNTFRVAPEITVGVNAFPGDTEVNLVWSPNTEENLTSYNIYRSTTSGSGFTLLTTVNGDTTLFTDTGLINGTAYFYKVSAVDSFAIESALSNEASATPATIAASQQISGIIGSNTVLSASGNPWQVTGDILIASGAGLFILPGTILEFQGAFKIRVEGELQVLGDPSDKVTIQGAIGVQWKGIEWIAGSVGASFSSSNIYQSGSALRNVDILDAGSNSSTWLRLEMDIGLLLEGVTIGNCVTSCLVAENLGTQHRITIEGGLWSSGTVDITGGGLDIKNATFNSVTLNQSAGQKPGEMSGSSFTSSVISLSRGSTMQGNTWSGGSLTVNRSHRIYDNTSDLDSFTGTIIDVDEIILTNGDFSGGSLTIGWFSTLDNYSMSGTPLTATGNVTLSNASVINSVLSMQHGVVEFSEFIGTSPITLNGNGQVIGNTMNANPITILGYGAVEENNISGATITLGNGLVRANTVTNGSIQVTGTEGTEILNNVVSVATAEGLRINPKRIVMAHNQITGADVGLLVTNGDILFFRAYDNTITANRIGIQWNGGCAADCTLLGTRFDLSGNTELAFSGDFNSGGLVNIHLQDSWWGTTDPAAIKAQVFDRFDLSSASSNTVGLLFGPWISGVPATADADGDTIVDVLDGDDDNDGICDLQEARESRLDLNPPVFFNPVDGSDTPAVIPDCDGDGLADVDDGDDDNDGLLDSTESGIATNPFSIDTDGDGVNDFDEFDQLYDPIDSEIYPMKSNRGYLDALNRNLNGDLAPIREDWIVHGFVSISAGSFLRFGSNTRLEVHGLLFVSGVQNNDVTLTSEQPVPVAGDWEGIDLFFGDGSRLDHVDVNYSGSSGLCVMSGNNTIVSNSVFSNNTAVLNNNTCGDTGGAINYWISNGHMLTNSIFENNESQAGGAVRMSQDNIVVDSIFTSNTGSEGAGLFMSVHNVVKDTLFENNSASRGNAWAGGIWGKHDNVMIHISIHDNFASNSSAGILLEGNNNIIRMSNFTANNLFAISSCNASNQCGTNNIVDDSYIAGNNGAALSEVDLSEGTISTSVPAQWEGVTLTTPRSTPHPDAPPIP